MAARGHAVPALNNRPELPDYLQEAFLCYVDTSSDGELSWATCIAWAEKYGSEDSEYLWDVVTKAKQVLDKWHSSKAQSPSPQLPPSAPAARK